MQGELDKNIIAAEDFNKESYYSSGSQNISYFSLLQTALSIPSNQMAVYFKP